MNVNGVNLIRRARERVNHAVCKRPNLCFFPGKKKKKERRNFIIRSGFSVFFPSFTHHTVNFFPPLYLIPYHLLYLDIYINVNNICFKITICNLIDKSKN